MPIVEASAASQGRGRLAKSKPPALAAGPAWLFPPVIREVAGGADGPTWLGWGVANPVGPGTAVTVALGAGVGGGVGRVAGGSLAVGFGFGSGATVGLGVGAATRTVCGFTFVNRAVRWPAPLPLEALNS